MFCSLGGDNFADLRAGANQAGFVVGGFDVVKGFLWLVSSAPDTSVDRVFDRSREKKDMRMSLQADRTGHCRPGVNRKKKKGRSVNSPFRLQCHTSRAA